VTSRGILGLRGQGMDGRKRPLTPISRSYPVGSHTFTATKTGWYEFALWGPGAAGSGADGGASGAFVLATRRLMLGQTASLVVGGPGSATSVTFPSGELLTAGAASGRTAGVALAAAGDTAIGGSAAGTGNAAGVAGSGTDGGTGGATNTISAGGSGAPGSDGYRGARGGNANAAAGSAGHTPGAGSGGSSGTAPVGGDGMAIVVQVKIPR
jgi:hypothetical protein